MNELEQMQQRLQRRHRALERMTADLDWLIAQPRGSLRWLSTKRDLVEMVHLVWLSQRLCDSRGRLFTRPTLASLAFAAVGMDAPQSLRHVVYELRNRRTSSLSMLHRYQQLEALPNIIARFVESGKSGERVGERREGRAEREMPGTLSRHASYPLVSPAIPQEQACAL